jgi:hypothetical protein
MSRTQLLAWWGTMVAAAAMFAVKYGELTRRKRRKMLLALVVFLLIAMIPVVLLYLAPDEWFLDEAILPEYELLPTDPGPGARLDAPPSSSQQIRIQ